MSTFKKAKVVILPSNEESNIQQNKFNKLFFSEQKKSYSDTINQHLYIISDDEIKEGDWYIAEGKIYRAIVNHMPKLYKHPHKKIITTTDESLRISYKENNHQPLSSNNYTLPKPSDSFIKKYIEEYNKDNIITDVLVEYKFNDFKFMATLCTTKEKESILKINPKDNTITIKKVKDSYTREEVENLIYSAMKDRCYTTVAEWQKWIEENL